MKEHLEETYGYSKETYELSDIIYGYSIDTRGDSDYVADVIIKNGYHKINKNSVVLSKEEAVIAREEAVKEFAEKLKERLNLGLYEWQYAKVNSKVIDELLKEYDR